MWSRLLGAAFPVHRGERSLTLLLFLHNFFAVGAFVAGRSVRDALFLAHSPRISLAWMYVASAVAVATLGLVYGPLAARVRRDRMATGSAALFALLFALSAWVERQGTGWLYPVLYVYVEVVGAISLLQFWTFANELFHTREAKRLYGLIGSGGTVANILVGLATGVIATRLGASALLVLCAGLSAFCAVTSSFAGKRGRQRLFARAAQGRQPPSRSGGAAQVLRSPPLRLIALLGAITFFTTTLVDFEFKVVASQNMSRDELAAYFGYFYAVVGGLAIGLQLFGVSRLLQRAGVIGALTVLPASLALGNLWLAAVPSLATATMAKGADGLFRYTINDATTQLLYLPIVPRLRIAAKAFIDAVVKPLAIGVGGLFLLGYRQLAGVEVRPLAWGCVVLTGGWLAVVVALRTRYIESLQDDLRRKRLDLTAARKATKDGGTQLALQRALESGVPGEILHALELLPQLGDLGLDHRVEALLEHPLPDIRVATLGYYATRETMRFANSVFRKFDDPHPKVRAAAIDAFCAMGKDKAVRSVRLYLKDADASVRRAAMVGMIRYGGLDGLLLAAEALKALIAHSDPGMREQAAQVLGAIGVRNFYQPVLDLLNDAEPSVRRAAVQAAAKLKAPQFVAPLLERTQDAATGREAIQALCDYGPSILEALGKVVGNRLEDVRTRLGAARVLGRLEVPEAAKLIVRTLDEPDEELRTTLYRSLVKLVAGQKVGLSDRRPIDAALAVEMVSAAGTLQASEVLGLGHAPASPLPLRGAQAARALLASALHEKLHEAERRMFLLLAALYPDAGLEQVFAGFEHASSAETSRRRATAFELLDNLLDRKLKRELLPLLEELPREKRTDRAERALAPTPLTASATLLSLCQDASPWVRACAIHLASYEGADLPREIFVSATADASPVVREAALLGLARLAPEHAREVANGRLADEAAIVREQASRLVKAA